jgi:hypothetical protein
MLRFLLLVLSLWSTTDGGGVDPNASTVDLSANLDPNG